MDASKSSVVIPDDQGAREAAHALVSYLDEDFSFEEPDDELEEFEEIDGDNQSIDPEVIGWNELWDTAGWDDEDANDEFVQLLQKELEAFQNENKAAE